MISLTLNIHDLRGNSSNSRAETIACAGYITLVEYTLFLDASSTIYMVISQNYRIHMDVEVSKHYFIFNEYPMHRRTPRLLFSVLIVELGMI